MQALSPFDLQWCVRRLPRAVRMMMEENGALLVVAGGYIRACIAGEKINDIDLFSPSKEKAEAAAKKLSGNSKFHTSANAYTVRGKSRIAVQFIHRWTFPNPYLLLDSFDFTVAKAAFWYLPVLMPGHGGSWIGICHDDFYRDLAAKRLVYTSPDRNEDAGGSMLRVLKFYQRGYRIPLDSLGAVMARMAYAVDPDTRLGSSESGWAKIFTGQLREVDPLLDPTHAAHLPTQGEAE